MDSFSKQTNRSSRTQTLFAFTRALNAKNQGNNVQFKVSFWNCPAFQDILRFSEKKKKKKKKTVQSSLTKRLSTVHNCFPSFVQFYPQIIFSFTTLFSDETTNGSGWPWLTQHRVYTTSNDPINSN